MVTEGNGMASEELGVISNESRIIVEDPITKKDQI
jgi:hypothetical protein